MNKTVTFEDGTYSIYLVQSEPVTTQMFRLKAVVKKKKWSKKNVPVKANGQDLHFKKSSDAS